MIKQLDPPIYLQTPRGSGWALLVIDRSQDHHLQWTVALDDGGAHHGEIWTFDNPYVRLVPNPSEGRIKPATKIKYP